MAPKTKITQSDADSNKMTAPKASTRSTRSTSKQPTTTPAGSGSVAPTTAATSVDSTVPTTKTPSTKRTIRDSQEETSSDVQDIAGPVTKKPKFAKPPVTEAKTKSKTKSAFKEKKKKSVIKASVDPHSDIEVIGPPTKKPPSRRSGRQPSVVPAPKPAATKRTEVPPPSRKRKASADIPAPSIEDAGPRRSGRPKAIKTETLPHPKPPTAKSKAKGKAISDPVVVVTSDSEDEIDFDFEHVGCLHPQHTPLSGVAETAARRGRAFVAILAYEYNKRKPTGNNQPAFIDRLVRKRKAVDVIPAPPSAPPLKKRKQTTAPAAVIDLTGAVDAPSDPAPGKRVRKRRTQSKKSKSTAVVASGPSAAEAASASSPHAPKQRKRKEEARVEAAAAPLPEEEDEDGEPWEHPPILSRTPEPEPGEERERAPTPDVEDPDGLYAPSVLTTIAGPDGRRYREFRRVDGKTGVEKVFWVPAKVYTLPPVPNKMSKGMK
jgi:hypothetical protein